MVKGLFAKVNKSGRFVSIAFIPSIPYNTSEMAVPGSQHYPPEKPQEADMDRKKFDEIIDFAVEREADAIKFYQDLQKMVRFNSQRELLHEFEEMEKGHIEMLEKIRMTDVEHIDIPRIQDLQISDYMVSSPPTADMNFEDIITIAMKREEAAQRLYTEMAGKVDDANIQKLFLRLAAEEAKHKLHFETLYDEEVLADN